jgi:hypothetical protein
MSTAGESRDDLTNLERFAIAQLVVYPVPVIDRAARRALIRRWAKRRGCRG